MTDAYFIDGARTAFGKAGGELADVRADDLAATVIRELVRRNPDLPTDKIEDVAWGATNQAGDDSRNVGRTAAVLAGLPESVAGFTVNRLCGSGLEAVATASRAIRSGDMDVCIAGGSESMSRAPFILPRAESGYQRSQPIYDSRLGWRGVNPEWNKRYGAKTLGECAEMIADQYGVTRAQQDEYAVRSHELAAAAWRAGHYDTEIVPLPDADGKPRLARDECIRDSASMESLSRLRPAFEADGSVTAGNSSPMNDGAAGMILAGAQAVRRLRLTPRARILGGTSVGVHPDGLDGPVPATRRLLAKLGWDSSSVDTVELTEAFASQAVACIDELGWKLDRVNTWGGAIAIGHPLGASGARLLTTLISRMEAEGGRRGIAAMCIGVGQGIAVAVELTE